MNRIRKNSSSGSGRKTWWINSPKKFLEMMLTILFPYVFKRYFSYLQVTFLLLYFSLCVDGQFSELFLYDWNPYVECAIFNAFLDALFQHRIGAHNWHGNFNTLLLSDSCPYPES